MTRFSTNVSILLLTGILDGDFDRSGVIRDDRFEMEVVRACGLYDEREGG